MQLIPDDDRHIYPRVDRDSLAPIHQDVTVTSQLLNLIVSFRWRPLIDANVSKDISQWLQAASTNVLPPNANYPPDFILISLYFNIFFLNLNVYVFNLNFKISTQVSLLITC